MTTAAYATSPTVPGMTLMLARGCPQGLRRRMNDYVRLGYLEHMTPGPRLEIYSWCDIRAELDLQ